MVKDIIKSVFKNLKRLVIVLLIGVPLFWIFVMNYSFTFKSRVAGEVRAVEQVNVQAVITNSDKPINAQIFSYSVAIKDLTTNEIHMASSEDRQWAAVQPGNCVVAAYFPYPPWRLSKGTTNHNARLLKNYMSCADLPLTYGFFDQIKFFLLWY